MTNEEYIAHGKELFEVCIKGLIELSKRSDHMFLMNKFNCIMIDGKQYAVKLEVRDE